MMNYVYSILNVIIIIIIFQSWQDYRLNWNSSIGECDFILIHPERLWIPDIVLLNGGVADESMGDPQRAKLTSNGSVTWLKKIDVIVPCTLELHKWPKDVQQCNFKFGSRRHTKDEIAVNITHNKVNRTMLDKNLP